MSERKLVVTVEDVKDLATIIITDPSVPIFHYKGRHLDIYFVFTPADVVFRAFSNKGEEVNLHFPKAKDLTSRNTPFIVTVKDMLIVPVSRLAYELTHAPSRRKETKRR